jgi:nucleoside-diphosphate-sugar epimerase
MKIMVTGAQGFVGSALIKKLHMAGYSVIPISHAEWELESPDTVQMLARHSVDYIFHLAGRVGVSESWESPLEFYRANVDATRHVLEYARLRNVPMHFVSTYLYGIQHHQPIAELASLSPTNPYAHSKSMAEDLCRYYQKAFQMQLTISRPFNIYGPGQPSTFFIQRVVEQILTKDVIEVSASMPRRDYIFIDDVADALIAIMEWGSKGEVYNIGTGMSFSCAEVIERLQEIMKTNKAVVYNEQVRKGEIPDCRADISKIKADTHWQPRYSLVEGLKALITSP